MIVFFICILKPPCSSEFFVCFLDDSPIPNRVPGPWIERQRRNSGSSSVSAGQLRVSAQSRNGREGGVCRLVDSDPRQRSVEPETGAHSLPRRCSECDARCQTGHYSLLPLQLGAHTAVQVDPGSKKRSTPNSAAIKFFFISHFRKC